MITTEKLKIFQKCNGDGDIWLRTSWWWQRNKIDPDDWALISQLIQDIKLIDKGLCSEPYAQEVNNKIQENCMDEKVIKELRLLAKKM